MRALVKWGLAVALTLGVFAAAAASPRALRRMEAFEVRRVEVIGTRYLLPETALAQSGLANGANLFDEPEVWRRRVRAHRLVADVEIERRLPATVVLIVSEVRPAALVRTPELRVVDAAGRVLPIDPAEFAVDLPVVGVSSGLTPDGRLESRLALEMVRQLEHLRAADPLLAANLSEIEPAGSALRVRLREPAGLEALLPPRPPAGRLLRLRRALADLRARGELPGTRRVDVRYREQVVVALTPETES